MFSQVVFDKIQVKLVWQLIPFLLLNQTNAQNVLGAADHTHGHVPHVLEGGRLSLGRGAPSLELGLQHAALHAPAVVLVHGPQEPNQLITHTHNQHTPTINTHTHTHRPNKMMEEKLAHAKKKNNTMDFLEFSFDLDRRYFGREGDDFRDILEIDGAAPFCALISFFFVFAVPDLQ